MNQGVKLAVDMVQQQAARQLAKLAVASNKLFVTTADNERSVKPKPNSLAMFTDPTEECLVDKYVRIFFQNALKNKLATALHGLLFCFVAHGSASSIGVEGNRVKDRMIQL